MDRIVSYTEDIRKFISGKKYAGKNIKTTDGKTAYITKTGIAKLYTSVKQLSNKNGCTTAINRIDAKWGDMGVPVGSLMVNGQSCGNETSYVQPMPPQTKFDWKFYIQTYPDLKITTEQQAKDHWTTTGIHQGLLPNATALSSMTNLGKIGYIDINTTMHTVPKEAHNYNGKYKMFEGTNVTGASMQDCSRPVPSVKYGDQIYIKHFDRFGSVNQNSILEFGKQKTIFFLRPPVGSDALTGTPLKYGDKVTIAMTSANVRTNDCGWWGCKVGYLNTTTSLFQFGPGQDTGGTLFTINVPAGSNYTNGTEVKYNNPFSLSAIVTNPPWSNHRGANFAGNDMAYYRQSPDQCKISCQNTPGCVGTVSDILGGGHCWLKNKFSNYNWVWWLQTSVLTLNNQETKRGYMVNTVVRFNNIAENSADSFYFQNISTSSYDITCDLTALQFDCNRDLNCTGFIHSNTENTWQKIPFNSTAEQYKISNKTPNIYIKEVPNVDMKDKSCRSGAPKFIDATMFESYPDGNNFVMNGDQCKIDLSNIKEKQRLYNNSNNSNNTSATQMLQQYPQIPTYTDQLTNISNEMKTKTNEYSDVLDDLNNHRSENHDTYVQQNEDLALLETGNKSETLIWGISSIVVIAMVVIMRNKI